MAPLGSNVPSPNDRPRRRGDRIAVASPLWALSGHSDCAAKCPLSGVKQNSRSLAAMAAMKIDIREKYGLPT
jgi:hypothetical protein